MEMDQWEEARWQAALNGAPFLWEGVTVSLSFDPEGPELEACLRDLFRSDGPPEPDQSGETGVRRNRPA